MTVINAQTGYDLTGNTPLCWQNEGPVLVDCPDGLKLEFTDKSDIVEAVPLVETRGAFAVVVPGTITMNNITMRRVKTNNFDVSHSNFHACEGGIFCSPFVKLNQGLLTSSKDQSKNLDTRERAEFDQEFTLPKEGLYQIVAHIRFSTDHDLEGNTENAPYLYDAASAIIITATTENQVASTSDGGVGPGVIAGIVIGVLILVGVIIGLVMVSKRNKSRHSVSRYGDITYDLPLTGSGGGHTPGNNGYNRQQHPMSNSYDTHKLGTSSDYYHKETMSDNTYQTHGNGSSEHDQYSSARSAPYGSSRKTMTSSNTSATSSNAQHFVRSQPTDDAVHNMLYSNENFKMSNIESSKIIIHNVIGSGSFGEVLRGEYSASNVAIKRMHAFMPAHEADGFVQEIRLLMSLRHPNIVQFIGTSWLDTFGLCAVTEFMDRGDLTTVLQNARALGLSWKNSKMNIAIDSAQGLAYLHGLDPKVIHRDFKSRNILVSNNFTAKLSDFGLSRAVSTTSTMTVVGSNLWLAPEMIRGEKFTEKADVYSFGVVLTELDTERIPFEDLIGGDGQRLSGVALAHQVAYKDRRPVLSKNCHPKLRDLAVDCMDPYALNRPTAVQILTILRSIAAEIDNTL